MTRVHRHAAQRSVGRQMMWLGLAIGAAFLGVKAREVIAPPKPKGPWRDYSDRSGLPLGIEASRGIARDAALPADMLTSEPLRPLANTVG